MTVHVSREGAVLQLELDRPGKLNAVTDEMWATILAALGDAVADPAVRAVQLSGANGAFSAGSDVTGFIGGEPLGPRIEECNLVFLALHGLPLPTLAKVDGVAAGSGANLALFCDFVVASERSSFAELFTRIGLSLDTGASWLLPRLVGERRARELSLLGDALGARTAADWGLISSCVPVDELDGACDDLLARLAALPPEGVAGTRRLLADSWHSTLREALTAETVNQLEVIESPAATAAITAFAARSRG